MHTSVTFFKLNFIFGIKNMIVNLNATICDANDVSETNVIRRIHVCKNILPALVHSTVLDTIFDTSSTILVMVPIDAGFFRVLDPILSIRQTLALHLVFRFKLWDDIDKLALGIAYLIHLLIY